MTAIVEACFSIEKLNRTHARQAFSCGISSLDHYLHQSASQDEKRHIAVTYILHDDHLKKIVGFYTLSSMTIALNELPPDIARKLPHYSLIPATLIGRLAVDVNYQKQGQGELLLIDALHRAHKLSQDIASYAVVVDAINQKAAEFYRKYGFINLEMQKDKLFLSMKSIAGL